VPSAFFTGRATKPYDLGGKCEVNLLIFWKILAKQLIDDTSYKKIEKFPKKPLFPRKSHKKT
jgi:hypothetical protein